MPQEPYHRRPMLRPMKSMACLESCQTLPVHHVIKLQEQWIEYCPMNVEIVPTSNVVS